MCETPVNATWNKDSNTNGQYEPIIQPAEYKTKGRTMRLKRGLLKEGFHCERQQDCRHHEYSLEVYYFGMSWFGLLNSFELSFNTLKIQIQIQQFIFIIITILHLFDYKTNNF